ncbi:MAG: hypothetical protein R3F19_30460 [Verrucomicrobiales bacterium]
MTAPQKPTLLADRSPRGSKLGVLRAEVDLENHSVLIDFDPRVISEERVGKVAEGLRLSKANSLARPSCTLVGVPRGGGAEVEARSVMTKLETGFLHRFAEFQHER